MTLDALTTFITSEFNSSGTDELVSKKGARIQGLTAGGDKIFRFQGKGQIIFENCHFKKLSIEGESTCKFFNCTFEEIYIKRGRTNLESVNIPSSKIVISGKSEVRMYKCEFSRISISNTHHGSLNFNNVDCVLLSISGGIRESSIKLYEMNCSRCEFSNVNLSGSSNLYLSRIKVKVLLLFCDSNLDSVEFDSCDFSSAVHFLQRSPIDGAIFYNISWFKSIYTSKNNLGRNVAEHVGWMSIIEEITAKRLAKEIKKGENFREFYEGYRRYKTIMSRTKNRPDEIYFKAKEYNAKYRQMSFGSDKIVLFLNKLSNNHGQYWFVPVLWLLVLSSIFYFLFIWSLAGTNGFFQSIEPFWSHRVNIFVFINPTHSLNSVVIDGTTLKGNSVFIDWSFRIISAYLIFQTVSAFRKFKE